jgi:oligopeptide/dipeptide ABC transporter ATP-binding protein
MLLEVRDLHSYFFLDEGELKAVNGVSFKVDVGETVALVGESGCGKTIVALSLLDLIQPPGRIVSGQILFDGKDLRRMSQEELRRVRGGGIGMIFQEPSAALNPVHSVGRQIADVVALHQGVGGAAAWREAIRLLGEVGIPEPEKRARAYPFELSGGMQQRALTAIALAGQPRLLIADEPTTALDLTVQAETLELLRRLQEQYRMAILLITHDIGVVAEVAKRVMVMYTGRLVEVADVADLFRDPRHPYSKGLLGAFPRLGNGQDEPLQGIAGAVPDFLELPSGCTFHPRCELADEECATTFPPMTDVGYRRRCACYKARHG